MTGHLKFYLCYVIVLPWFYGLPLWVEKLRRFTVCLAFSSIVVQIGLFCGELVFWSRFDGIFYANYSMVYEGWRGESPVHAVFHVVKAAVLHLFCS